MRTLEYFEKPKGKTEEQVEIPEDVQRVSAPSEGFIIDELEIEGFMRYLEKTTIKFPEKFTVIVGRTGSGKTTLLDAITFAFYGCSSRTDTGVKMADLCREGGKVKVSFQQGGKRYEVVRGFTTRKKSYLTLKINSQEFLGNIEECEEKIKEILGLDYIGFRNSTFVRQEEMKALGSETGAERLKTFQKLFRLEIFEKAQTMAQQKFKELESEIGKIEVLTSEKRRLLEVLPEMRDKLKERRETIGYEKVSLTRLNEELEEKEKESKQLLGKHEEFVRISTNIELAKKSLEELEPRLKKALTELKETENLKLELAALEKEVEDIERLREATELLKEKLRSFANFQNEKKIYAKQKNELMVEHENELKELTSRVLEKENRIKALRTEIDKDQAFSLLRTQGKLDERISRIDLEIKWLKDELALISKLKEEQHAAKKDLKVVSEEVASINVDSFVLSELKEEMSTIKSDLTKEEKDYQVKLSKLEEQVKNIETRIADLGITELEKRKLNELEALLSEKWKKKELLDNKRKKLQKLGDVSRLASDLETRKEETQEKLNKFSTELEILADDEKRYKGIGNELKLLQNKKIDCSNKLSGLETELKMLSENIEKLENTQQEIEKLESEEKELREKLEVYTILKECVFHKKDIVMYAINQLLPTLALETSKNLSDLTDNRFNLVNLTPYEEKKEYGIRIEVLGVDNILHDVSEFSGGERTQINAALRFAIAKQLALLPQAGKTYGRMKTLFIDEGDLGSLDTETSRELFVRKLFDLGKFFDKIILITHLADIAERPEFTAKITVTMSPEGISKIEY
jgi:exonuclease SbcC